MVAQESHRRPLECLAGIGFTGFSMTSFAISSGYGVFVIYRKLKTLKRVIDNLTERQEELLEDIDAFYAEFRARGLYIRSDTPVAVPVDSQYLDPTFGRRVLVLTRMHSPFGGFWRHYVNMIVGFSLGALTHGILRRIVGTFCLTEVKIHISML
ncbi:uncharacterized protein LOC131308732 [Rhododendron vialii]|uniref:uncharacterized protein LOC131308732 n=1 Tax=Rhododendron vialii TaxID=182163 RepID=UPI00265EF58A|nr:uncharacterized protein LOC131308732 [Rhododendron vialii]